MKSVVFTNKILQNYGLHQSLILIFHAHQTFFIIFFSFFYLLAPFRTPSLGDGIVGASLKRAQVLSWANVGDRGKKRAWVSAKVFTRWPNSSSGAECQQLNLAPQFSWPSSSPFEKPFLLKPQLKFLTRKPSS